MTLKCLTTILISVAAALSFSTARAATPEQALRAPVELQFIDTPLQDVADFLTDYAGVSIRLSGGVDAQQPITTTMANVSLETALGRILAPRGLKFESQGDHILISRVDPALPPPEYGYQLRPADAAAGWIALFDGKTTFGWSGSKIVDEQLVGGESTSSFGDYQLRAYLSEGGGMKLGGKEIELDRGAVAREVTGKGPIVLGKTTSVRMLAIRPLSLKPLFNGRDLGDWNRIDREKTPVEKRPQWLVEDGVLRAVGGPGCIEYPKRYGDFVMQVDVRTRAQYANAGVFFRSVPGDVMNGYEAQVYNRMIDGDPAQPFKWSTGSIDDRQLARRVVSRDYVTFRMTVVANGPHIATWVNGYQLIDWTDTRAADDNPRKGLRLAPGTIQLQAHDAETDVEFRAVNIAPLE